MGTEELLCPSVWPSMPGAKVFGVVDRSDEQPKLVSLQRPVPVTPELLELVAPADPTHVFRFSGKCAGGYVGEVNSVPGSIGRSIIRNLEVLNRHVLFIVRLNRIGSGTGNERSGAGSIGIES